MNSKNTPQNKSIILILMILTTTAFSANSIKDFFKTFEAQKVITFETSLKDKEKLKMLDTTIKNYLSSLNEGISYKRNEETITIGVNKKYFPKLKANLSKKHSFYLLEEDDKSLEISKKLTQNTKNLPKNISVDKTRLYIGDTNQEFKQFPKKAPNFFTKANNDKEDKGIRLVYYFKLETRLSTKAETEFKNFVSTLKIPKGYKLYYKKVHHYKSPYFRTYILKNSIEINESYVVDSKIVEDKNNYMFQLQLKLNEMGKKLLAKITQRSKGKRIAMIINDEIISIPVVQEKITGGTLSLSPGYSNYSSQKEEIKELSNKLQLSRFTKYIEIKE